MKNNLTIVSGEWGGDSGERDFRDLLSRTHGQNQGGGWTQGREGGLAVMGWRDGEKMQTTVVEK